MLALHDEIEHVNGRCVWVAPAQRYGHPSVLRRSDLYLSSEASSGWRRDRVSAGGRQVEGLFTTLKRHTLP